MAGQIAILSTGSARPGLQCVADAFQKQTGQAVSITYNMDEKPSQRLDDGEIFDVVVASTNSLKRMFLPSGHVVENGVSLGRSGVGMAVRAAFPPPLPDISSSEALQRAVLQAESLLLTNHASGFHVDSVFRNMGIAEQLEPKITRFPNAPDLLDRLAISGEGRELGFSPLNMIADHPEGIRLVAPLPHEVQLYFEYVAVPAARSTNPEGAREFVHFCVGPGKPLWVANGMSL